MRHKITTSAILTLLFLCISAASTHAQVTVPDTEGIPKKYADIKVVSLVEDSRTVKGEYTKIKVRLINPTKTSISFTGYSESSPWYLLQTLVDNKWTEKKMGWFCGTGLRQCIIYPGESSIITLNVTTANLPIKVGVAYKLGTKTDKINKPLVVWSPSIEATATKKAKE